MKLLLWLIAILLAAAVLVTWKLRGREPRVLRGRLSPALLRRVVMLLMLAGIDRDSAAQTQPVDADHDTRFARPIEITVRGRPAPAPNDPAPLSKTFPARLNDDAAVGWARINDEATGGHLRRALLALNGNLHQRAEGAKTLETLLNDPPNRRHNGLELPPVFREILAVEIAGTTDQDKAKARPIEKLSQAADELAAVGYYSSAFVAYLWRTAPADVLPDDAPKLAALYAKLEDHARATQALTLAQAQTGQVQYVPWMSKASPPAGYVPRIVLPKGFIDTANRLYPTTPAGPWETDAAFSFKLIDEGHRYTLHRRGHAVELKAGDFVRLRRLDVLVSQTKIQNRPLTAEHRTLGQLNLPTVLTSRRANTTLTPAASAQINQWIQNAHSGDADALKLLEMVLPAARPQIDASLDTLFTGPGAPSLRTLRLLYDE